MSKLYELTLLITENTAKIDQFLSSRGLPWPSFNINEPQSLCLSGDLRSARQIVLEATIELHELLLGPKELLFSNKPNNLTSLHAIYQYRIAESFPVGQEATFGEISAACGLDEMSVKRVVKHAAAHRIFREVREGIICHTSLSQLMAQDKEINAWAGVCVEEMWPAAVKTVPAMLKWPNSQEPNQTGFSISNNTNKSMYEEICGDPSRAQRFGEGMSALMGSDGYETCHIVGHEIWDGLAGTVVDVGGAHGDIAISLADRHKTLTIVVQDLPATLDTRPGITRHLDRVSFMPHDFFLEQPIKDAKVYFFRWIFHNWSDDYCVRILRSLIPALNKDLKVVVNDVCLPGF